MFSTGSILQDEPQPSEQISRRFRDGTSSQRSALRQQHIEISGGSLAQIIAAIVAQIACTMCNAPARRRKSQLDCCPNCMRQKTHFARGFRHITPVQPYQKNI
jgi:hypothetical protein